MAVKFSQTQTQTIAQAITAAADAVQVKPKAKAKPEAIVLAEELIDLDYRLKQAEAYQMLKRVEELKKRLQSIAQESGAPAEQQYVFDTEEGQVVFSPCRMETTITNKASMITIMGQQTFNEVAKVTLTDARKYLSENELATVSVTEPGGRTLKAIMKKE
jgi:hypothetical protein